MSRVEKLRRAWLLAAPADRPLIAAKLREAMDDDHFYGAYSGGGGGRGGSKGGGRRVSAKDAGEAIAMLAKDKREHGPLMGARGGKAAPKVRPPTDGEYNHESTRIEGFLTKYQGSQEKLDQAIRRRAEVIASPQKLYNFILGLENENLHTVNRDVMGIFKKKFGPLPNPLREARGSDLGFPKMLPRELEALN